MRRPRNTTEQLTGTSCVMKHGKSLLWIWNKGEVRSYVRTFNE